MGPDQRFETSSYPALFMGEPVGVLNAILNLGNNTVEPKLSRCIM